MTQPARRLDKPTQPVGLASWDKRQRGAGGGVDGSVSRYWQVFKHRQTCSNLTAAALHWLSNTCSNVSLKKGSENLLKTIRRSCQVRGVKVMAWDLIRAWVWRVSWSRLQWASLGIALEGYFLCRCQGWDKFDLSDCKRFKLVNFERKHRLKHLIM